VKYFPKFRGLASSAGLNQYAPYCDLVANNTERIGATLELDLFGFAAIRPLSVLLQDAEKRIL